MDSEEDDDATSWDGGDEEEEPDQMDLDDEDDDDLADQSSDEEQEPQSLVVTLQYRKKSSNTSSETKPEPTPVNGVAQQSDVQMTDAGAPLKQEAPAVAAPLPSIQPAAPPPHVIPTAISNGFFSQQPEVVAAPKVEYQPPVDAASLPKRDGFFSAPTPPYSAPEEAPKHEQPQFQPVQPVQSVQSVQPEAPQQPPHPNPAQTTTHAPNWQ
jgi:hypothetical protein